MSAVARADLESLLRTRQLDRTLTTYGADQQLAPSAPTDIGPLDVRLAGGFPRGQLSEVVGPRSSGRMSLLCQLMSAATARGELVALVDALDTFDVESASAAGIDFGRLLWIRGHATASPGACRDMNQRAIEQALRALTLVLQAGTFGLVVFDAGEAPPDALRRLPFTTWLRLQRMVEGADTVCVLVGRDPMARSSAGLTLRLEAGGWRLEAGDRTGAGGGRLEVGAGGRLFEGLDVRARVIRARARAEEDTSMALVTRAVNCA
jgi:hypothetical protein